MQYPESHVNALQQQIRDLRSIGDQERELRKGLEKKVEAFMKVLGNKARCRGCDAEIYWVTTKNGKKAPFNEDGTSHFSNCPHASSFRDPKGDRHG